MGICLFEVSRFEITYRHSGPLAELASRLSNLADPGAEVAKLQSMIEPEAPALPTEMTMQVSTIPLEARSRMRTSPTMS